MNKHKFNLSPKRLISRLSLTFVFIILFGIVSIPFMRQADGLLFEQKAAVGGENMWKFVALWALFTTLLSFITFWKKRFRMVSILLIICWIIGLSFVFYISTQGKNKSCNRTYPYQMPAEFDRALNLIAQRLDIEKNYNTVYGNAFAFKNCLNIQYSDEMSTGAEGLFLVSQSTPDNLKILVKPEYKSYDDLSIATVLMHELTHVGQYLWENVYSENKGEVKSCMDQEAEAFLSQQILVNQFNDEEKRSIYARISENIDTNPAFPILLQLDELTNEAYRACAILKNENNLTQVQFNECTWTGAQNKLKKIVEETPYYQKQCSVNTH